MSDPDNADKVLDALSPHEGNAPNVDVVLIVDKDATWEVFIAWQRGKAAAPVRSLIDALSRNRILNN